ncbi:MAG: non-ribosomal peptide synthetase, partial [Actinomycetota bacterium]|nr:non-ribosomal peptide synthetase [Actinomycetota bacterium]
MTTVADLLEGAAAGHAGATAVVAGAYRLTYAELGARANRLAHHLRSLGVGREVRVGVCLERSADLAVALQAVLRAGGACLPLDPEYPADRLAFMVDDAGVAAVLTRESLADRLPASSVPVLRLDADEQAWTGQPVTPPSRSSGPDDVGYVIYTSGSTGEPKGVMLTHRGLVNHHRAVVDLYGLGPGDRVLQFCSLGFDASVEELFPTWAAGGTVVFRPDDVPLLGRGWVEWLGDNRITVLNLPTAYWQAWTSDLTALGERVPESVRLVVVGGEKARGGPYRAWQRLSGGRSRWVNAYGPTETTCMSTYYEPAPGAAVHGDPPIGRPLPNTTLLVVDDRLQPVPGGVTGELLIGGAGLARGYLNHPELTAERFVDVVGGARMYRTGDLVRLLPSGDLEYMGRVDDQVKIRGFRVELGEVEAALSRHPAVEAGAVVARDGDLHAYAVAPAATVAELRRFLSSQLPSHMLPVTFTILDALRLTPNGKVDRAALPEPSRPAAPAGAPRSPGEERMRAIWAGVLGLDPSEVGGDDDFFDLGGHSLLATQVVAQVREEFGTETALRALFEAPTVAGLTAVVEAEGSAVVAG